MNLSEIIIMSNNDVTLFIHSLSMDYVLKQKGMTIKDYIDSFSLGKKTAPIYVNTDYFDSKILASLMINNDVIMM